VLYHCIAGEPPFLSGQSQDIIHSHLAEIPTALEKRQSDCPSSLSNIIATLLEKQTEKRYQTVLGLKQDLLTCQQKLAHGDPSDFPLKRDDFSNEIVLPSILLGREKEQQALLGIYQNVCQGKLGVAYVSGLSGIGKSRLVQELEVPILMQQGLFAAGKYNQFSKHQPYATIAQAIGRLIRQILTETAEQLSVWKNTVLDVAGINGQLLIAVIPELSLLIGPQPEANPLPPVEARNRFNDLFCRFMTCLATKEHPLVLFVDDLQWCDDATLDLLDQLFSAPDRHPYLLLILAFRSNEVANAHRIRRSRESLKNGSALRLDIDLSELDKATVNEMTAYILGCSSQDTCGITNAIYPTSGGNPLLVNESLRWLHQHDGIFYDESGRWQWQEAALGKLKLPDGYLALFSEKLSRLPSDCQKILAAAALLGARFKANDLAELLDISHEKLLPQLSEAFSQRILVKEKTELVFGHDQIQMAAAKLNSSDQTKFIHHKIAQKLLLKFKQQENSGHDSEQGQQLYSIAEHLKKSRDEQRSDEDRFEEATINLLAGKMALLSLAHSAADYYFAEAVELCNSEDWAHHYGFMLSLYKNYARSALLMGKQIRSNDIIDVALKQAKNDSDRAECLLAQIVAATSLGTIEESIELADRCCRLLQHPLPETEAEINAETAQHVEILKDPDCLNRYRDLPATSSQKVLIELALYEELLAPFYLSGRVSLYFLCAMRSITIALQHGKSATTCYSLDTVGSYFHFQEKYELAQQYQTLVLEVAAQSPYEFTSIRAITQGLWLTMHHCHSLEELQELCRTNIQHGMRAGELNYTGLTYMPLIWYQLTKGDNIAALKHQITEAISYCEQFDLSLPREVCRAIEAALMPLWGALPDKHELYVEQKLAQWHEEQHLAALCNYYCYHALLNYHQGNYLEAEQSLINAESFLCAIPGTIIERLWQVYRYLTGLHTHNNPDAAAQLAQVAEWSQYGPIFKPYLTMMKTEAAVVNSDSLDEIRNHYWAVIDINHEHGRKFQEASAYQRLGTLLDQHKHHSSHFYINEAIRLYKNCRADSVANALSERFQSVDALPTIEQPPIKQQPEENLDSAFLLEAIENIMQEHDYDALLLKILSAMMARVGAKNGYLITLEDEKLCVRAHGRKNVQVETVRLNQEMNITENLCPEVAWFTVRSQSPVVLENASQSGDYCHSQAVQNDQLKSILALPLIAQGRALGLIYLENSLLSHVFDDEQVSRLKVLTAQAAIALDNSLLIASLKHTQETLIQREQNLAITLNSIGDGVIVTDQLGNVSSLNPIAEKLTGWSMSEAAGKSVRTIFNIVDQASHEAILNPIEKVLASGETIYLSNHTTLIAKDGQEYQISDSAAPIRNDNDNILGVVLVFSDITEDYRLRQEVTESHLKLQQIMNDMHAMVATLSPEGEILFVNKKPLTLSNLNLSDLFNQRLWDSPWFNADKNAQQQVKNACLLATLGQPITKDLRMQTLDGLIWIEFGVHPVRNKQGEINLLVCEGHDISRRKLAEQNLKDEQALQALLLDNLTEAVVLTDHLGVIKHVNDSGCRMFGYSEQELINKNIEMVIEENHIKSFENYRLTIHSATVGAGIDIKARRKNGEVFPFHITIAELPEIIGGQQQLVASGHDLTDRELQQEMLQRSQKMDALGKLTGGIAHDYNNMLGVILGYSQLLESALENTPKQRGFVQQIRHAAERGATLTKKLLSYSQQKVADSSFVNINEHLLSQQEMLEKTLTARIQLQLDLDKNTKMVNVNLGDLEDAVLNLCINAMHAMPDGGHLTIQSSHQNVLDQDAKTLQLASGEYVVINISDTGKGMDKVTQMRIFDPFFSTKGEMGTGLGLTQAYGFMERSHGAIKVYSELGYGSRFSLYFPVAKLPDSTPIKSSDAQPIKNLSGTESILVVDDEPALLALLKEVLEEQGYRVFCAENATNAMKIIKRQPIDLVLSDIIMPGTNGYQLANNIAQYDPSIIIQLMSGFDDKHKIDGSNQALHSKQLTKPIKIQVLLERVRELLSGSA